LGAWNLGCAVYEIRRGGVEEDAMALRARSVAARDGRRSTPHRTEALRGFGKVRCGRCRRRLTVIKPTFNEELRGGNKTMRVLFSKQMLCDRGPLWALFVYTEALYHRKNKGAGCDWLGICHPTHPAPTSEVAGTRSQKRVMRHPDHLCVSGARRTG